MNMTETVAMERGMLPIKPPATDRLPPMLFLAALFHALVILGVTFDAGLTVSGDNSLTLDVVVLNSTEQRIDKPLDATYLAAVSQTGAGNSQEQQPAGAQPLGVANALEVSELLGDIAPEVDPNLFENIPEVTTSSRADRTTPDSTDEPEPEREAEEAISLPTGAENTLPLPERDDASPDLYDPDPRELVFSVDTRESELAGYLAAWKLRVETEGTRFYSREQLASFAAAASPVIEVALDANGDLTEIIVVRSSGTGVVDQAALNVLRQASPYAPIPAHLRADYDSMRFRYRFEFALVD